MAPGPSSRTPAGLTWAGGLDLGLALLRVGVEEVWGRVLAALDLALEGVQTLDVLLLERAGGAARRAHIQVGGQFPPLLVLVHLVGDTSGGTRLRKRLTQTHAVFSFGLLQQNRSDSSPFFTWSNCN